MSATIVITIGYLITIGLLTILTFLLYLIDTTDEKCYQWSTCTMVVLLMNFDSGNGVRITLKYKWYTFMSRFHCWKNDMVMYICWKMSCCDLELSHLDNGGITLWVSALVNNHSLISNSVLLYIYMECWSLHIWDFVCMISTITNMLCKYLFVKVINAIFTATWCRTHWSYLWKYYGDIRMQMGSVLLTAPSTHHSPGCLLVVLTILLDFSHDNRTTSGVGYR